MLEEGRRGVEKRDGEHVEFGLVCARKLFIDDDLIGEGDAGAAPFARPVRRREADLAPFLEPVDDDRLQLGFAHRSEEHTSELQSLMRNSYAVFCLKKKNNKIHNIVQNYTHTQ